MKEYYYQIKGKSDNGWSWPPIESGKVLAFGSSDARKRVEELHNQKFSSGRKSGKTDYNADMLLSIIDMEGKPWLSDRFIDRECTECSKVFTLNDKYLLSEGGDYDVCSFNCKQAKANKLGIERNINYDFNGIHEAVIYKITSKITGLCYIGKTTQAFTFRWYQHFYQSSGTKFHAAIYEQGIDNWTFEVIEVLDTKEKDAILSRESFWIRHYDCINNGYNTLISKKDSEDELNQIDFKTSKNQ